MGPCDGDDGTPVPTGTDTTGEEGPCGGITGTVTDPAGAVPMGTEAETTGLDACTTGTEWESEGGTAKLDVNTAGTLDSTTLVETTTSGVVEGLGPN